MNQGSDLSSTLLQIVQGQRCMPIQKMPAYTANSTNNQTIALVLGYLLMIVAHLFLRWCIHQLL